MRDGIGTNYLQICDSATGVWSEDAPVIAKKIRELISGEGEEFHWEYPCHSPSEKRWFLLHVTRFRMGGQIRIVLAHETITERKLSEEALRESTEELAATNQELLRSNQDLELFAYAASHDLQEPLRGIVNALQMLAKKQEGELGEDSDRLIRLSIEQARKMHALIQDLLKYSRIQTRGNNFQTVNTHESLNQSILNLKKLIQEKGTKVTYDKMPQVWGDSTQLLQVFQNLIGNAVKFGREDSSQVHVSAERRGHEWVFSVRDNGMGIEAQYFDRIFEIFQQLRSTDSFEGTGIGLAIVKKIVERHNGRVWVESEIGVGSIFYFAIPTVQDLA
jgi:light-regulated signal transduction histidine kinase (bacteriophytochrome)